MAHTPALFLQATRKPRAIFDSSHDAIRRTYAAFANGIDDSNVIKKCPGRFNKKIAFSPNKNTASAIARITSLGRNLNRCVAA
jgi:hypothetical protein